MICNPEHVAMKFHEAYERLAPEHGYKTREETAVPWDEVPANNKSLMIACAKEVMDSAHFLVDFEHGQTVMLFSQVVDDPQDAGTVE